LSLVLLVIIGTAIDAFKSFQEKSKTKQNSKSATNQVLLLENKIGKTEELVMVDDFMVEENVENKNASDVVETPKKDYQAIKKEPVQIQNQSKTQA
jgi:hypothetical protein